MKSIYVAVLLVSFSACVALAQRQGQNQIGAVVGTELRDSINANFMQRAWAMKQWRVVEGRTNNLTDPGWAYIQGTVAQNTYNGLHVYTGSERILIANAPATADDQPFQGWAKEVGLHSYSTVGGSSSTIRKFDYGVPVQPPAQPVIREAPPRPLTIEEQAAQGERILKYQFAEAEKGLPSFQYIVGRRYLNGDGVTQSVAQAKIWFNKAAEQGNTDARAALEKLR